MERIGVFFFLFLHRFPEQGCRGSLMDLDFYELTYMIVLLVKDNHLVLAGSSEQLLTGTFRESFYQNLESLAYIPQVTFLGQLILQIDHTLQTAYLLFFRYIILQMASGICTRTLRIFK